MLRRSTYGPAMVVVTLAVAGYWLYHAAGLDSGRGAVVLVASLWIGARILFAASERPTVAADPRERAALDALKVAIVVPVYNEDPGYFGACLASIAAQTRPPSEVWIVDDCSIDTACYGLALEWAAAPHPFHVEVHRLDANAGKRHAQAVAFRNATADVFVTLDSDSILDPLAVSEGLMPFRDDRVRAVAGVTVGHNWRANLLTRIVDVEYVNSFILGRASMSRVGSVLVACGTLAFHRADHVRDNLDDYLDERFLGAPVRAGDDRRLTQYALLRGQVRFQETSLCYTALPERLGHLVRQRLRWGSSFYRGAWWVAANVPFRRIAWWWTAMQVVELGFIGLMMSLLFTHWWRAGLAAAALYFFYMSVLAYMRSIRYVSYRRRNMTTGEQAGQLLIAPLISLLYTFVLTPVRFLAVLKVRDNRWGTRRRVEVATTGVGAPFHST